MSEPFAPGEDHPACGICPSKQLPREAFVVYDRPSWECPFNTEDGLRYTADRTPACVHPHKVGLDPDRIAPPPKPVDDALEVTPQRRRGWRPSFLGW
ncbi:hypothetical protein [Streptomyces sp. NPDC005538]|uniref:hypothetical protein n=1 Tax=Streptomyces sp. NPDC005538 TaxID=3157043 RepID=UPI0033A47114